MWNEGLLDKFNEVESFHWWWEGRRKLIQQLLPPGKKLKILEIGCGTGETLSFLNSINPYYKLYGIDSDTTAVRYATRNSSAKIVAGNALKLPFRTGSFDVILLLDVLEHIQDHVSAVKEAKRVLKKGGVIIATCPALSFIWSAHDSDQGHFRRYKREDFRLLAKTSGLSIKHLKYFNFFMAPPIIAIRLASRIPRLQWLASYNRSFNYDIAHRKTVNTLLKHIFRLEIRLSKYFSYPVGISLGIAMEK